MRRLERGGASEPGQHRRALQPRRLGGQQGLVGGVGIAPKVVDDSVVLRIAMDVPNQGAEAPLRGHVDPSEALLKKAARPAIGFVDGFGVAVEEVRELLGRVLRRIQRLFVVGLDAHEQVEVVFHQAVRERLGDGLDVLGILIQEVALIFRFEEKILDAPVVDVVVMAGVERREMVHGACVLETFQVFETWKVLRLR